jgi:hypothetical protein
MAATPLHNWSSLFANAMFLSITGVHLLETSNASDSEENICSELAPYNCIVFATFLATSIENRGSPPATFTSVAIALQIPTTSSTDGGVLPPACGVSNVERRVSKKVKREGEYQQTS